MFGMKGLLEFHIPSRGAAIGAITEDDGGNSTTMRENRWGGGKWSLYTAETCAAQQNNVQNL